MTLTILQIGCAIAVIGLPTWLAWELWRAPLIDDADEGSGEGQPKRFRGVDAVGGAADFISHTRSYTDV